MYEGESFVDWELIGRKGGWENAGGLGSEFANSSGVSMSELLNWEIALKMVRSELVSESMLDDVLHGVIQKARKQKVDDGNWVLEVGWVGNGTVKGSNLSAHRGLKKGLF